MPEQLKVHHPASVISASTIPAARCGPLSRASYLVDRTTRSELPPHIPGRGQRPGFDSDIGSFGNFFYPVRRVETMVDGAHSHLPCFSLPCQRNAFSRSVIRSRRSMSSSMVLNMSFSGRITSVVCRARPYRRSSNSRMAAIRALSSQRFASLPG